MKDKYPDFPDHLPPQIAALMRPRYLPRKLNARRRKRLAHEESGLTRVIAVRF